MSDDAPNKGRVHQHQVVFFWGAIHGLCRVCLKGGTDLHSVTMYWRLNRFVNHAHEILVLLIKIWLGWREIPGKSDTQESSCCFYDLHNVTILIAEIPIVARETRKSYLASQLLRRQHPEDHWLWHLRALWGGTTARFHHGSWRTQRLKPHPKMEISPPKEGRSPAKSALNKHDQKQGRGGLTHTTWAMAVSPMSQVLLAG